MMTLTAIERPGRWDYPLDPSMQDRDLQWLLSLEPFASMDKDRFSQSATVIDILRSDSRINRYEHGDVIVREGDYGSSAYIVLRGQVRILITQLAAESLGRATEKPASWWQTLRDSLRYWPVPEMRSVAQSKEAATGVRQVDDRPRVFLQDATAILDGHTSEPLGPGELFGELAAITRSSSSYTVIADGPVVLLEIRWQGLRLLRRDPMFQKQLDRRYREASLTTHLRETPLFRFVPPEHLEHIAQAAQLVSLGDMEWFADYRLTRNLDVQERIQAEPFIVQEGAPANGLILIRSGFARLSYQHGHGHRTLAYLGRGQVFGLSELVHNADVQLDENQLLPYQESLRGIGFVDVLKIPRREFLEHALPFIRSDELPSRIDRPRYDAAGPLVQETATIPPFEQLEPALLEFLVDNRLMNGRQTMLIDTERCTRCDDCVRACARTHQGNPRFVRNGPQFGPYQFAQACMHCVDPVCMIGCPTGAIARDTKSGVISINPNSCIGCKVCAESCPYDNIVMVQINDLHGRKLVDRETQMPILQATKCDLCQSLPIGPACQAACPHDALVRINMSDLPTLDRWMRREAA
ncbi:MAG: cyclic nucleotide-binding domain-containing protein [Pirellulaceae bacterium]|nr:cyclic nucleotide-binding domain-containing protein [Pirellulaceae bacterium]